MKNKRIWIWIGVCLGLVVLGVAGGLLADWGVPDVNTQLRLLQAV